MATLRTADLSCADSAQASPTAPPPSSTRPVLATCADAASARAAATAAAVALLLSDTTGHLGLASGDIGGQLKRPVAQAPPLDASSDSAGVDPP
jgi:hypothetical protein